MRRKNREWVESRFKIATIYTDFRAGEADSDRKAGVAALEAAGRALSALIDLAHQRITALCDHLGVSTEIVPAVPSHYEVFPRERPKGKSDDKTGGENGTA